MLKVGVKLTVPAGRIGDYLAEVTALEASGADSIWLDDVSVLAGAVDTPALPIEPWIVYGAMAAVTHRIRLGAMVGSASSWPATLLASSVKALSKLSGGRVVVGVQAGDEFQRYVDLLVPGSADAPAPAILVACDAYFKAERYALLADGVILIGGDERRVADVGAKMREFREAGVHNRDFELWVAVSMPADRAAWARMVAAHEAAGATGVVVSWDPRLIDLLRNAGEPDDRTDLLIATG
jgi:alkanesulfonate monooxygenase SsuD/methylene tetrahydromethanopterin reductase-like flavin-dependent oxidoreductase (luciferase family)